jgi:SNF family Na+-dependent transporter
LPIIAGAFLIPYVIMLVFTGLPIYGLELCLGQYTGLGANKVFGRMLPLFQGYIYTILDFSSPLGVPGKLSITIQ